MRERGRSAVGALAILLFATACSSPVPPSPSGDSSSSPTSPAASVLPSGELAGLLLNEVLFAPGAGDSAFVEIANVSAGPIDPSGATLRLTDRELPLANAPTVPAGGELLVLLDGLGSVEGSVIHAPSGVVLPADIGSVDLLDGDGNRLDRVAWGDGDPAAVANGPGGIVPERFPRGSSLARAPGTTTPASPEEWVVSAQATPGEANPAPTVSVLLPLSGAILDTSEADLSWYPVPGAARYRVQVATAASFASPAMDVTTTEPQMNVATLSAGSYFWRVSAIGADGSASEFSEPGTFELRAAGTALLVLAEDTPGRHLSVPLIDQRKDTAMLLLERNVESGAHPWDKDHRTLDESDPADNMNCVAAMAAMLSAFYGGNLSQDRIGYEALQRRGGNPPGPEGDLIYGHGINPGETTEVLRFALGGVTEGGILTFDDAWNTIVSEIDAGRPLGAANTKHAYVVTGYEISGGRQLLSINDPWHGRAYKQDIGEKGLPALLWLMPANPTVRKQEAAVTADSDGDGVVDFDESERFRTNPNDRDSDGDSLPDKQDIISGVFDPKWGYAVRKDEFGRDFDSDGNPTELDKDSDDGGCMDGEEDKSLNGHREPPETWNFNADDDSCAGWRGTMSVTRKWTYSNGMETGTATTTFNGVFVPDTNPQHFDPQCQGDNPPDDCVQIFVATGTISWSFQAQCGDRSDSGSGSFEAGTGFVVPEFDWEQQALYLRKTPDGKSLQYWGEGVMVGVTDQGEPYCPAGNSVADAERYFFEILEDAADRQPYSGTIQSCIGRTWEIDVKATSISGTCRDKSVEGETDSSWTWNLVRQEPPAS